MLKPLYEPLSGNEEWPLNEMFTGEAREIGAGAKARAEGERRHEAHGVANRERHHDRDEVASRAQQTAGPEEALRAFFESGRGAGSFDQLPIEDRQRLLDNARTLVPA